MLTQHSWIRYYSSKKYTRPAYIFLTQYLTSRAKNPVNGFRPFLSFLLTAVLWRCAFGLAANTTMVNTSSAFFIGPAYMYSVRTGYYDFDEIKQSQRINRARLNSFGAVAGKRFALGKSVRIQGTVGFDMGTATDDTLYFSIPTAVRHSFIHCGIDPELQVPFPSFDAERLRPFLTVGGGLNYLYINERTYTLDGSTEIVWIDQPYIKEGRFSADGGAGFGFDFLLTRDATMCLSYSFRYWQPVRYGIQQDFPRTAQPYHEDFRTHKVTLSLLLEFK